MDTDDYCLTIEKINDVYIKIHTSAGVAQELCEYFTFMVPGAHFSPKFKAKMWDGKIRLFNPMSCLLYVGLLGRVYKFCDERGYDINDETGISSNCISEEQFTDLIKSLDLPEDRKPRDYQLNAAWQALKNKRLMMLCPTASGKSLIIHMIMKYLEHLPVLIVVPTKNLVVQMRSDLISYGADGSEIAVLMEGKNLDTKSRVVIATWQGIFKQPKKFFARFKVMFGDEAHLFKAKSLIGIMQHLTDCPYKFGTTGTLDGTVTHQWVLEGLFGPVKRFTTTKKLIEQGHLSDIKVVAAVLNWPQEIRRENRTHDYAEELSFVSSHPARNKFLCTIASQLKGNTLILVQLVEKQLEPLVEMMRKECNKKVYTISGSVDGTEREEIRQRIMAGDECVIVATYGTYSTGVNIPNLNNLVLGSPTKSKIRLLQSIGRVLRKAPGKDYCVVYDIVDDLSWKSRQNHTMNHFLDRSEIYAAEGFEVEQYRINLQV